MLTAQTDVEGKAGQWGLGVGLQRTEAGVGGWRWGNNGPFKAFFIAFSRPKDRLGVLRQQLQRVGYRRTDCDEAVGKGKYS